MRNPMPDLPPVTLPQFECGTDDRILISAALMCLAVLVAAEWVVWRVAR